MRIGNKERVEMWDEKEERERERKIKYAVATSASRKSVPPTSQHNITGYCKLSRKKKQGERTASK